MAEIVNLRMARKRALKAGRDSVADANRVSFGMPKALKDIARREAERAASSLDGRKREPSAPLGAEQSVGSHETGEVDPPAVSEHRDHDT